MSVLSFLTITGLFSVTIQGYSLSWYLMQPGIIRVQSYATVSKDPNTVILSFTISGQHMKYDRSISRVNIRVETLRDELDKSPVGRKALKTTNFSITSDSRYDEKEKGRIFPGFVCKHDLRLELPFNKQELGKIIDNLVVSMGHAEMKISFDVRDMESLHTEILGKEVLAARDNAGMLVKLPGYDRDRLCISNMDGAKSASGKVWTFTANLMCESLPDIEPVEIEGEDSVTVTWELLENFNRKNLIPASGSPGSLHRLLK